MKFTVLSLVLLLNLGAWAVADETTNKTGQTKQNPDTEASGHLPLFNSDWIKKVVATGILSDGTLKISYNALTEAPSSGSGKRSDKIELSFESRLYGKKVGERYKPVEEANSDGSCGYDTFFDEYERDSDCKRNSGYSILPFETRIRVNLDDVSGEKGGVEWKDAKVGLARWMIPRALMTVQVLSYVMHDNDFKLGRFQGFEVAHVTLSGYDYIPGTNGVVEFVFKGYVSGGFGAMTSQSAAVNQAADSLWSKNLNEGAGFYTLGGSLGLKFNIDKIRSVTLEGFGGKVRTGDSDNLDSHKDNNHDGYYEYSRGDSSLKFNNKFYGAGLRMRVSKNVDVLGTLQKDSYAEDFSGSKEYKDGAVMDYYVDDGSASYKHTTKSTTGFVTLELRY